MTSIILPGEKINSGLSVDVPVALRGILDIRQVEKVLVGAARDDDKDARTEILGTDDTDLVETELENGLKLWQSVADARADFADVPRSI